MAVLASRDLKDGLVELNETRKAVENAENRARLEQRSDSKPGRRNDRELAQSLHREADRLYHSGDYESALVLYHRAANLFPRDGSHSVAARRTAATISSCNNPSKALRGVLPSAKTEERLVASLCPESAAIQANDKLRKSPDPSSVAEVLSYFDDHKSYWKTQPSPRPSNIQLARSRTMLKRQSNLANVYLKNLESAFASGEMSVSLKIAQELLVASAGLQDPSRYQIGAYRYLSLIHVALGRHDRAVYNVSRLIRLSKSTGDVVQFCRSLVTLGKVHLSFGHLNAAAKAWEHLSSDLKEPVPVAWIRHEIGRCYLETGRYRRALEMASRCIEAATKDNSEKWMLHGRLLLGQSLAKLGRLAEALDELQIAAKITEEEGDNPMLSYIRDLIDQVSAVLGRIENERRGIETSKLPATSKRKEDQDAKPSDQFVSRTETIITAMFSQRRVITELRGGGSSAGTSVDADEEATMHSKGSTSLDEAKLNSKGRSGGLSESTRNLRISRNKNKVASSSSSSSSSDDQEPDVESARDLVRDTKQNFEEASFVRSIDSETSINTVDTSATYVIDSEEDSAAKSESDNEVEPRGMSRRSDKGCEGAWEKVASSDKNPGEGMLNDFRLIEELANKNAVELLDVLTDMLLSRDGKDRSRDLGNSGDAGGEKYENARSCEDSQQDKLAACHSLYKHSLPSSPRKRDVDEDFNGCEATSGSDLLYSIIGT